MACVRCDGQSAGIDLHRRGHRDGVREVQLMHMGMWTPNTVAFRQAKVVLQIGQCWSRVAAEALADQCEVCWVWIQLESHRML